MNEDKKEEIKTSSYSLFKAPRNKRTDNDVEYMNLYIVIDGHQFELVPHCRTKRETAYFYALFSFLDLPLQK